MNASFNEICRASMAEEQSRAGKRVGKVIPQGGKLCQNEEHGKGGEVTWKTRAKQPPKRLRGRSWQQCKIANNFSMPTLRRCCSNETLGVSRGAPECCDLDLPPSDESGGRTCVSCKPLPFVLGQESQVFLALEQTSKAHISAQRDALKEQPRCVVAGEQGKDLPWAAIARTKSTSTKCSCACCQVVGN